MPQLQMEWSKLPSNPFLITSVQREHMIYHTKNNCISEFQIQHLLITYKQFEIVNWHQFMIIVLYILVILILEY
jgi:hypothetical protein